MSSKQLTIAIDGPAGSGKSTISKRLARTLGYKLVDTGAIYRCVALAANDRGISDTDPDQLRTLTAALAIDFCWDGETNRVRLDGEDVTERIRAPEISDAASRYSSVATVREELLGLQRSLAGAGGAVLEGRDIGTVVCPEAPVKFFLDASVSERARRRALELEQNGLSMSLEQVEADIRQRDRRDAERDVAPLKAAADAIKIDSTNKDIDEVVGCMLAVIRERQAHS